MKALDYALYFFIYSILGWCVEVVHAALKRGKFENRGFLNGCWCPLYGAGAVLVLVALTPVNINILVLFAASFLLTSALELAVGFVLEKLFKTKWWDYSKEPFNFKGYICVKYSLYWGLACVMVADLVHPVFTVAVGITPFWLRCALCAVLGAAFIADVTVTIIQLVAYNKNYAAVEKITESLKKPSDAIGGKLAASTLAMNERLQELTAKIKSSRLYKAFPDQSRNSKSSKRNNKDKD